MPNPQRTQRNPRFASIFPTRPAGAWLACAAMSLALYTPAHVGAQTDASDAPHVSSSAESTPADANRLPARNEIQQRAQEALERSGATTDLHEDRLLDPMPIQIREQSIPRKFDLDRLPNPGCHPSDATRPKAPGCMGCGQCAGPAQAASSMGALGQLIAALLALLTLGVLSYLLYTIWQKRRYPTHRALEDHDLLGQARALSPTAVEDAAAARDYNAAIHALFLRTLLRLHDAGYTIEAHWTPRQVPRRIDAPQNLREALSGLVHFAEYARFANHRSTEEEFERAQRAAASVDAARATEGVR